MQEDYENIYHEIERDHFWFKARRSYIHDLLKPYPKDIKILDIGCSSGILMQELIDMGFEPNNIFGVDISQSAIDNCKKNGLLNAFQMDAQEINLQEKFDVLIASDCLEHLEDDHKALKNWHGLLKPQGKLLVFVPAFMSLWSHHDVVNMHFRRYTRPELKGKLTAHQFVIEKSSYWNFSLFLPIYSFRQISKLKPAGNKKETGDMDKPSALNSLFYNLIKLENKTLQKINFPFGVSTFCIARKN